MSVLLHSALARDRHGGAAERYDEASSTRYRTRKLLLANVAPCESVTTTFHDPLSANVSILLECTRQRSPFTWTGITAIVCPSRSHRWEWFHPRGREARCKARRVSPYQ